MKCVHTHDSGPYVLGALLSADREAYERHLAGCAACRDDVAELAVLPGLLGRLDLATVESLPPAGESIRHAPGERPDHQEFGPAGDPVAEPGAQPGLPNLISSARRHRARQRRSQRWRLAGATLAAAMVAVLALVIGGRAMEHDEPGKPPADMVLMQPVAQPAAVTGWVSVHEFTGGSRIELRCGYTGGADGVRWTFRLVVVPRSGADEHVGSWTASYGQEVTVDATTSVRPADIARVELRSGSGSTLLVYTP